RRSRPTGPASAATRARARAGATWSSRCARPPSRGASRRARRRAASTTRSDRRAPRGIVPRGGPPMTDIVLTLIGADRPGLVEAVAGIIAAHGGNWLESRMTHLAGKFAGILRAELPPDRATAALQALGGLERQGLRVIAEAAPRGSSTADAPARAMQ